VFCLKHTALLSGQYLSMHLLYGARITSVTLTGLNLLRDILRNVSVAYSISRIVGGKLLLKLTAYIFDASRHIYFCATKWWIIWLMLMYLLFILCNFKPTRSNGVKLKSHTVVLLLMFNLFSHHVVNIWNALHLTLLNLLVKQPLEIG